MANVESASTEPEHRLGQVLGAYYEAEKAGRAPTLPELQKRHPDLASELAAYFAEEADVHRLTEPLRQRAGAAAHQPLDALGVVAPGTDSEPSTGPWRNSRGSRQARAAVPSAITSCSK